MGNCNKALGFWKIGIQYLHLVQAVSNETYQQRNAHFVVSDESITEEQYIEKTKWSDHNLAIPLLFNFYHGLELLLKGFLCSKGFQVKASHKLSQLLSDFKIKFTNSSLIPLFEKYIEKNYLPDILSEFCKTSNIFIDDYYQALKYAEGTSGNQYLHHPLKYRNEKGIAFFADLRNDIEKIRRESIILGRQVCPKV